VGVRTIVEIVQGAAGDQVFPAALAAGEQKREVGDLLGQYINGAIDPDYLLIGVGQEGAAGGGAFAAQPGDGGGGELGDGGLRWRGRGGAAGDVEAEQVHWIGGLVD
jgi:hypothetical protein